MKRAPHRTKRITDTQRMDFLARQRWTRWVGFDHADGHTSTTWPVFAGDDLRGQIDLAMRDAERDASMKNEGR